MAEVLSAVNPDGQGSFYNSRKSSPASSSLFLGTSPPSGSSQIPYSSPLNGEHAEHSEHAEHTERVHSPVPSSFSFSPRASTSDLSSLASSNTSPPSSGTSLEDKYQQQTTFEDGFLSFDAFSHPGESSDEQTESATTATTESDSPLPTPTVADDTAIKQEPSQHVDYLSHDWREEDVWSSWRHIVSQRRVYGQQSRLENAAWRTWVKSKYGLPTVSPETLNWLKESDVTWLYGPLKPATSHPITHRDHSQSPRISRNTSFAHRKPILKKRSMSEVMLQRSISASSLLKQAAASVEAQGSRRPNKKSLHERTHSDYVPGINSEVPSRDQLDYFTSRSTSGLETPCECREKRHIRFDDKVEQCIAVDVKQDDEEEAESEAEENPDGSDSEDEGVVMMRRPRGPGVRRSSSMNGSAKSSRNNSQNGRKTIETLPSTTLKYRSDTPDNTQEQPTHVTLGRSWSSSTLSPSPSQETLRPARPSRNFLIDDEDEPDSEDSGWSFGASNPKSSLGASERTSTPMPNRRDSVSVAKARQSGGYHVSRDSLDEDDDGVRDAFAASSSSNADGAEPESYAGMEGMRRTESGMFMPYEEDEDDVMAAGLFGRVSETINTARDIAHVIWNVGWRSN